MAETLDSLVTRLQNRMGYARLHSQETARFKEAINSSVAHVLQKGAPGVTKRRFSAFTWGSLSLSNFSHAAGASTATTTDATVDNVVAGDILDVAGTRHVIYGFDHSVNPRVIDLGAARQVQLVGAATIYRRSIVLPSSGAVIAVIQRGQANTLPKFELAAAAHDRDTGSAECYEQSWDADREKSLLMLYPAPTTATEFTIVQSLFSGRLTSGASELPWPEEAIQIVLAESVTRLMAWGRGAGQIEAVMAEKDANSAAAAGGGSRSRSVFKQP